MSITIDKQTLERLGFVRSLSVPVLLESSHATLSRPDLLRNIRPHCEDSLVKVLTGLRRSGKSSLLRLIAADTAQKLDLPKEDFLFLDFEDSSLRRLTRPEILHDYIAEKAKGARKRLTVFLDEVRTVESWEKVVRSLQDRGDCDLFVATSGADPLSGESTLLAGRTVRFEVTPYSFREFRAVRKTVCADVAEETIWRDYLAWGGMPAVTNFADVSDAKLYLIDVFRSILLSDVTARRNLRDTRALETTLAFAAERCGERLSLGDFADFLSSQRLNVSRDTIADYLRAAADAGLLLEVEGDEPNPPLRRRPKRFLADHGFREALSSGRNERDPEPVLKNIVLMELRRRGWRVQFGAGGKRAVDFVAEKEEERLYVQVRSFLDSREAVERAFEPFYDIPDNRPKLVLSPDPVLRPQDGFRHENLHEWFLKDD